MFLNYLLIVLHQLEYIAVANRLPHRSPAFWTFFICIVGFRSTFFAVGVIIGAHQHRLPVCYVIVLHTHPTSDQVYLNLHLIPFALASHC